MSTKLNLRLRPEDRLLLNHAAELIAGPAGAPYVRRIDIVRRGLVAFVAAHSGVSNLDSAGHPR